MGGRRIRRTQNVENVREGNLVGKEVTDLLQAQKKYAESLKLANSSIFSQSPIWGWVLVAGVMRNPSLHDLKPKGLTTPKHSRTAGVYD